MGMEGPSLKRTERHGKEWGSLHPPGRYGVSRTTRPTISGHPQHPGPPIPPHSEAITLQFKFMFGCILTVLHLKDHSVPWGPPTSVTWGCSASPQVGTALGYHPDVGVLPAGIPGCRTFGFSEPAAGGADRGMHTRTTGDTGGLVHCRPPGARCSHVVSLASERPGIFRCRSPILLAGNCVFSLSPFFFQVL